MGIIKVIIALVIIGSLESIFDKKETTTSDRHCFEIAMSILMAAWIIRSGW